jgi:hypothetical protein
MVIEWREREHEEIDVAMGKYVLEKTGPRNNKIKKMWK